MIPVTNEDFILSHADIAWCLMFLTTMFNVLTHVLIVAGIAAMVLFVIRMIASGEPILENAIRSAAAMTGFLIYFGAKTLGLSIPSLMMNAVATTNPLTFGFFAVTVPSAAGILVAWYVIRCIDSSADIASRTVILLATFIIAMFADVYAVAYDIELQDQESVRALVPNLTFTIAMSLYVIFKYQHKDRGRVRGWKV